MNAEVRPLQQLNKQAIEILIREMGVVDAFRFLGQFDSGLGNYTEERHQWLDDLSLEDITSQIKTDRNKTA